jgi:D-lactate dehydrogenase
VLPRTVEEAVEQAVAGPGGGGPAGYEGAPDLEVVVFGHLGVGDLHVNLLGVPDRAVAAVETAVVDAVVDAGGRPFGEHGVGVQKRAWLPRTLGAAAVAELQAIRRRADPSGLCNPGVRLPDPAAPAP